MSHFMRFNVLLSLLLSFNVWGQLTGDPATIEQPVYPYVDPQRAVVISINFNSATDVNLLEVLVANTRARTAIGAPPQLVLELLDHNDEVISTRNAWHPLWETQWDEAGEIENGNMQDAGEGTFYVPLSSSLRKVRITDTEQNLVLITVDVSQSVISYCDSNQDTPICVLFMDGFE